VTRSQLCLYRGDAPACREAGEGFDAFFRSALAGVSLWRAHCHLLRAQLRLAGCHGLGVDAVEEALRAVEADVAAVERIGLRCHTPLTRLVRAGIAASRQNSSEAVAWLDDMLSVEGLRRDHPLVAAIAELRKGELVGGDAGARLRERADALLRSRGVVAPGRLGRLYAPSVV
jgi:hypothetical protein